MSAYEFGAQHTNGSWADRPFQYGGPINDQLVCWWGGGGGGGLSAIYKIVYSVDRSLERGTCANPLCLPWKLDYRDVMKFGYGDVMRAGPHCCQVEEKEAEEFWTTREWTAKINMDRMK